MWLSGKHATCRRLAGLGHCQSLSPEEERDRPDKLGPGCISSSFYLALHVHGGVAGVGRLAGGRRVAG
jgi:hypothetical protein